jgi:hypothetical protein
MNPYFYHHHRIITTTTTTTATAIAIATVANADSALVIAVMLVLDKNADNREYSMTGTFRKHGFLYLRIFPKYHLQGKQDFGYPLM